MPSLETIARWMNLPLFTVGSVSVRLGGLASAVLVFFGILALSAILRRVVANRLVRRLGLQAGVAYAIGRVLHYALVFLGFILAAQCVGLDLGSLAVVVGFLSVGIGFGLQNVTANFIAGLILLFERPISVGDFVTVDDQIGTVTAIGIRSTRIRTLDNVSIIVPNNRFVDGQVVNWSRGDARVRIHVPVGVAYGSDVPRVVETLLAVARAHPEVLAEPSPTVQFRRFGDSSLDFELLPWIAKPERQNSILSELNVAVAVAFRAAGIQIPFPQRDVHIRTAPPPSAADRSREEGAA